MRGRTGVRRARGGSRQSFYRKEREHTESFKWRLSLHSVCVSNLSYKVSRKELWDSFNEFGVVVDVILPPKRNRSASGIAFVRYRYEEELRSAISRGNGRNLYGRLLLVRKALARSTADRVDGGLRLLRHSGQSRNEIILKEAEATFEVSQALGIAFLENRSQIVSRLANLDGV
ncbi:hypothetical protein COLO4_09857 [Corchorus olitorius]|uniref:RRM domain-containing protein n=1 Tax=Corchorus olitorius TaxID=93759 RepID=A0A1R3KAX3_9ROSI|nr:hypothetical protein COLO4_09857 [Corchorus olitorius]